MKVRFILTSLVLSVFALLMWIPTAQAQYQKTNMRNLTTLNVGIIPYPPLATGAGINTYDYLGKTQRELASIGAKVTTEDKSEASVIIDLDMAPATTIGYACMIRIRFMKKIDMKTKKRGQINSTWITLWEQKKVGFVNKSKPNQELLAMYDELLKEFIMNYSEANN